MNDIGIIILVSLSGIVLLICLYWLLVHYSEDKKVNNRNRWKLIKFIDKNPEVLPL